MPTFEYTGLDTGGASVRGRVFAADEAKAREDLTRKGVQLQDVRAAVADPIGGGGAAPSAPAETLANPVAPAGFIPEERAYEGPPMERRSYMATSVWGPLAGRVPLKDLTFFFRQLATMMSAGVPVVQSLDTLARQSQSPKLREVVGEIRGHVLAGRPMTAGMQRYPEVFSPVMLSVLRIGESGGFMDRALNTAADYTDREIELRAIYRRVTFMPKLELAFSIIIIIGANLIIGGINAKAQKLSSPLTTLSTWFWLGPLIVGVFLFLRVGLANFGIKYYWDTVVSHLPYLGNTMRQLSMAKFGRAFSALYTSGVPVPRAIELGADACGNEWMRARIAPVSRRLEGGEGIARTLAETGVFSPIVLDMVATGETTGSLDQMLDKVSEYYEQEATVRAQQTAQVLGIAIALLVMIYIGYIVITFYTSYYGSLINDNT